MANQIAEKLEALNCPENMRENALRFSVSLTCISLSELKDILDFLMEKGVVKKEEGKLLLSPKTFKILPRGLEYIKGRVAEMEEIGELDAYKEKPYRINIQDANLRILYMKNNGEPYKTEEGKYSMLPFNKREFDKKYGDVDLSLVNTMEVKEETNTEEEQKVEEITPVVDDVQVNDESKIVEETHAIEETPVVEEQPNIDSENVSMEPIVQELPTFETPIEPVPMDEPEETEEVPIMDEVNETQDNIIDAERYERLSGYLSSLYKELFGMDMVPSDMLDCLKKFMEETDYEDKDLLYELLTSGSNYPEEAKAQIMGAVQELTVGRVA